MSDDFYRVDSGDPAPDNEHITGVREKRNEGEQVTAQRRRPCMQRIAVYDDMLSTPRVIVIEPQDVRTYLEEPTNTVYQCMKEQGGHLVDGYPRVTSKTSTRICRAHHLDSRRRRHHPLCRSGSGIDDKERAFGTRNQRKQQRRAISAAPAQVSHGTEYLKTPAAPSVGNGTVVTAVSLNPKRVQETSVPAGGAAVRPETEQAYPMPGAFTQQPSGNAADSPHAAAWHAPHKSPRHPRRDSPNIPEQCRWARM
ncbi:MAG: hypothetical protein ACLU0O_03405 [Collinsella sp.]